MSLEDGLSIFNILRLTLLQFDILALVPAIVLPKMLARSPHAVRKAERQDNFPGL